MMKMKILNIKVFLSPPEKAKEAVETNFNDTRVFSKRTKPKYKYEDMGNGCFKVTVSDWECLG